MNFRCLATAMIVMCWAISLAAVPVREPNILIIVADDLGYADLGFQGGTDIPTPSIDDWRQTACGSRTSMFREPGVAPRALVF